MKKKSAKWVGYLIALMMLLISCAGTDTQTKAKVVSGAKPVSNILVLAVTGNEHNRRSYEKKFVTQLKSVGVAAVSSEESIPMPPNLEVKVEMILNAVNQYKNDAVIITQLIGKESKDVYTRGTTARRGLFRYSRDHVYADESTTVRLETNLYDAKTGELIWTAKSNTWSQETTDKIINDVIKAAINSLQKNKLIAPK